MSSEKCWIGGKAPKIQRSSCSPRRHCKWRFGVLCNIHRTRIIKITNDGRKSHGYHFQIARLRWTSSRRSICLYPSENGRCSQIIEYSKIGMSRHSDSSTTNGSSVWKTQWFLLSGIYTVTLWQDLMGKAIWENPIEVRLGEGFKLGMLFHTPWKRIIPICVCGWHKHKLERKNIDPMWKVLNKEVDLGEPTSVLDMYTWDALEDNVK